MVTKIGMIEPERISWCIVSAQAAQGRRRRSRGENRSDPKTDSKQKA
jgi:hypothetical protein